LNQSDSFELCWIVPLLTIRPGVPLSLREANRIAQAALKEAESRGVKISASICDDQGRLIVHQRMDGASAECSRASIGKAIAAVTFGAASGDTTKIMEGYGPHGPAALVRAEGVPLLNRKGGLPVFRLGEMMGAVGVSGASDEELDEKCARAGIAALDQPT
jgi:uncharacterized protein GlcG (DUF336 family)